MTKRKALRRDYYSPGRVALSKALLKRIKVRKLGRLAGYVVWVVDGAVIRGQEGSPPVDVDFALGGNPARYSYMPEGEIWVEWTGDEDDVRANAMHEVLEAGDMREGLSYDEAHERALESESPARFIGEEALPVFVANPRLVRRGKRAIGEIVGWPDGSWGYDEHVDFGALRAGAWVINFGLYARDVGCVEGATEYHLGLRGALPEIVAVYPELFDFSLSFDGPPKPVRELLETSLPAMQDIVFLHGTSSELLPTIGSVGLRPRAATGTFFVYGRAVGASPGRADAVYLTTQESMARAAARAAVAQFGGEPVMVRVTGLTAERMASDEDSRKATAEESLAVLGSVAYVGTIPPSKFVDVVPLSRR